MAGHIDKEFIFNPGFFFPWPARLNLVRRGLWKKSFLMLNTIFSLMDGLIKTHLEEYNESKTR
ncbi:unnamed protein product, partial [Allacma fusca]